MILTDAWAVSTHEGVWNRRARKYHHQLLLFLVLQVTHIWVSMDETGIVAQGNFQYPCVGDTWFRPHWIIIKCRCVLTCPAVDNHIYKAWIFDISQATPNVLYAAIFPSRNIVQCLAFLVSHSWLNKACFA